MMRNPPRITLAATDRALERIRIMESRIIPQRTAETARTLEMVGADSENQVHALVDEAGADLESIAEAYWKAKADTVHAYEELACSRMEEPGSDAHIKTIEQATHLLRGTTGLLREILAVTDGGNIDADDLNRMITSRMSELAHAVGGGTA